jgi:hypothetical protein
VRKALLLLALLLSAPAYGQTYSGGGGGSSAPIVAYQANRWYRFPGGTPATGTTQSTILTYCQGPYPLRATVTTNALGANIQTLGTSTFQLALYADSGGRPGALIINSGSIVDTSTGATSVSVSSTQIVGPANIWECEQANDTTVKFLATGPGQATYVDTLGSATLGGSISTASMVQGISTPGTYATWPNPFAGAWTDTTTGTVPIMSMFVVSSP